LKKKKPSEKSGGFFIFATDSTALSETNMVKVNTSNPEIRISKNLGRFLDHGVFIFWKVPASCSRQIWLQL